MTTPPITVLHHRGDWLPQTETWLHDQVRNLPPEIMSVIFCERTQNLDQFDLPHIHSFEDLRFWRRYWDRGLRKLPWRRHLGHLLAVARSCRAQILHSHFADQGWVDLQPAKQTGMRQLVSVYGFDITMLPTRQPEWRERYRSLFRQVSLVLCEGPHMAHTLFGLGCPEEKVRLHHLGVRVEGIPFKPREWDSNEPLRVLIAASFREKKGIPYALEALAHLRRSLPVEITIVGDASDSDASRAEKARILATIENERLATVTRLLGFLPHQSLLDEAYRHHLFLSPSITASDGDAEGGLPVSLIELMAAGMPVVSTFHCDIPELVIDGCTGLLALERDVGGLVEKLRWLAEHPERWGDLAAAGRCHVAAEYDGRVQGRRLAEIYREVAAFECD